MALRRILAIGMAVACLSSAAAQPEPETKQSDLKSLRWMAQQIGVGPAPGEIDPRLLEMAKQFMKDNPDYAKSPEFLKKQSELQKQFQNNPAALQKLMQGQGMNDQQLRQTMEQMRSQGNGGTPQTQTPSPLPGQPMVPPQLQPGGNNPNPNGNGGGMVRPPEVPQPPPDAPNFPNGNPGTTPPEIRAPQGYRIEPPAFTKDQSELERQAQATEGYQTMAGLWESNIGPLDHAPELKSALIDAFSGTGGGQNPFGNSSNFMGKGSGKSPFMQRMQNMFGKGSGGSWLNGLGNRFSGMNLNWLKPGGWTAPSVGGSGFGMSGFSFGGFALGGVGGLGTLGIVFIALVAVLVLAFVLYRYWPAITALRTPKPIPGRGPWPIDPRSVHDRATLITCFEYLSLNLCGDDAKVWNHTTIAAAIRQQIPGAHAVAVPLAHAYALARYTPPAEELTQLEIGEARAALCQLAGVPA
jgi:hypothetical protein